MLDIYFRVRYSCSGSLERESKVESRKLKGEDQKMMESEVSTKRVAANQANCQKSTGPKSPEGKARASLNSLKTGAYAKTDNALRQIMLKRGENPADFEQLHEGLTEDWHPDDLMQAMVVKTIAEKSFDKAQLRAAWMESQLTALQVEQIQNQRRQLRARRWLPGTASPKPEDEPLWLEKDRPNKFKRIFDLLDCLQKWFDARICPDEYPAAMDELYGESHSQAGEKIRTLFIQLFDEDDKAGAEKAAQELPKWIAQERRDVGQERDLYQKEMGLRAAGPTLNEDQVARKEAALEKQIREQTRLLLQLKRAQFREQGTGDREQGTGNREQRTGPEDQGTGNRGQGTGPSIEDSRFKIQETEIQETKVRGTKIQETAVATNGPANGPKREETMVSGAEIAEKREIRSNEANQPKTKPKRSQYVL